MFVLPTISFSAGPDTSPINAVPDYGKNDCVSFKKHNDTNPLSYPYGYACVTSVSCEVFDHACSGEYCDDIDYSKGTRTSVTAIPASMSVSSVLMGASGVKLSDRDSRWCLVEDGSGNFWALDKKRGSEEWFTLENLAQTVVSCRATDYFSSQLGCIVK